MSNLATLVSFVGSVGELDGSWLKRQALLHKTALKYGNICNVSAWTRKDILSSDFYRHNKELLDTPRGCGYWAWKPWVILETLKTVAPDDYVIYHDVGNAFRQGDSLRGGDVNHGNVIELPIDPILEWAEAHNGMYPGVNTPHYGPASKWTRRDCFVGMGCDDRKYWDLPLVQAGYNAWKNTPEVREFLEMWLSCCCDLRLIRDGPNVLGKDDLPDFVDHRHDQSILSNLLRREGIEAFGSTKHSKAYVRNFNYLIRRASLDQKEVEGAQTLTKAVSEAGGSWNLPVSVTNWIDLDISSRNPADLNVLCIRSASNVEESILRGILSEANWDIEDWRFPDQRLQDDNSLQSTCPQSSVYDWIFAYGFNDQALLCHLIKVWLPALKPMGFMIAGLDYSQEHSCENTFSALVKQCAQTRVLKVRNEQEEQELKLVVGTASNPIELKRRKQKPIIAVFQKGVQ